MKKFSTAIVGGGASGIVAAISCRRNKNNSVVICEKLPCLGKKILASGSGKCNLLNEELNDSFYNASSRPLVWSIFEKFGKVDIINFFKSAGLRLYSEGSRVFPATNQASSVLKILELELKNLSVPVELGYEVIAISGSKGEYTLTSRSDKKICAESVVITGGGKSYPALGSDGSAYKLAATFGHKLIEPVPVAVPLLVKDSLCHLLQGQKIFAKGKAIIDGKLVSESAGDLLFTKYGLSGTCILDISEEVSIAINRDKKSDICVSIDMVPFMKEEELKNELSRKALKAVAAEDMLTGILPNKFGPAFKDILNGKDAGGMAKALKEKRFKVLGTRGWNEAEFTAGGVATGEIKKGTLESKLKKGLYFAGEVLDVNGKRGGYNMAWAWASGFVAGMTE